MKSLIILFSVTCCLVAQNTEQQTMQAKFNQEIDSQVWKPFKLAFDSYDAETMNSLHTDDVLRATKWGIRIGDEYKQRTSDSYQRGRDANRQRSINFWLEQRVANEKMAYEIGYYNISQMRDGKQENHIAQFHVVLRKEAWALENCSGLG